MVNESLTSAVHKERVLVVDDDEAVLRSTVKVLEKNGYDVDSAQTGREAIQKTKVRTYNVAIIDLRLPDMEGIDVLSEANLASAVKIMLTGYPSLVSGLRAMDQGVDAYLHKPVNPKELVLLIKSKLQSSSALK